MFLLFLHLANFILNIMIYFMYDQKRKIYAVISILWGLCLILDIIQF